MRVRADAADQRRQMLQLTEKGRALVNRLRPLWAAITQATEQLCRESAPQLLAQLTADRHRARPTLAARPRHTNDGAQNTARIANQGEQRCRFVTGLCRFCWRLSSPRPRSPRRTADTRATRAPRSKKSSAWSTRHYVFPDKRAAISGALKTVARRRPLQRRHAAGTRRARHAQTSSPASKDGHLNR